MKIAINCAFYQPKGGGVKEYIDNLINNLAVHDKKNEYILYVLQDQIDYAKKNLPAKFRIKTIPYNSKSLRDRIKRSLFEQQFWRNEEKEEGFDIFHSPFFHSPKFKKVPVILTVHDLRLYRYPQTYEFLRYVFLKRKVKASIKKANHIISISNFTASELKNLCDVSEDKITVIHEAINRERFTLSSNYSPEDIPEKLKRNSFLLAVGHMEPRKNYDRLINAFKNLKAKDEFKDFQLIIVGKKDHSYKNTLELIESTKDVNYLNFVSLETLLWLYKNAALFVFPSYYEGFGFPPLEAASFQTVSAVSNISSIPEVCGEAAFYFDPFNVENIAETISLALTNEGLMEDKRKKLTQQLEKFSWEKNALETMKIYNRYK